MNGEYTEAYYNKSEKYKDFLEKYNLARTEMIKNGIYPKSSELCKIVSRMPMKRFYISSSTALRKYSEYKKGKVKITYDSTAKMFSEIFVRYEKLLDMSGGITYDYLVMDEVLNQEAPCFYLSDASSILFYYKALKFYRKKS